MKNTETTIEEILNSDFLNNLIEQEDKDLKEAGWTYEEVKELVSKTTNK